MPPPSIVFAYERLLAMEQQQGGTNNKSNNLRTNITAIVSVDKPLPYRGPHFAVGGGEGLGASFEYGSFGYAFGAAEVPAKCEIVSPHTLTCTLNSRFDPSHSASSSSTSPTPTTTAAAAPSGGGGKGSFGGLTLQSSSQQQPQQLPPPLPSYLLSEDDWLTVRLWPPPPPAIFDAWPSPTCYWGDAAAAEGAFTWPAVVAVPPPEPVGPPPMAGGSMVAPLNAGSALGAAAVLLLGMGGFEVYVMGTLLGSQCAPFADRRRVSLLQYVMAPLRDVTLWRIYTDADEPQF